MVRKFPVFRFRHLDRGRAEPRSRIADDQLRPGMVRTVRRAPVEGSRVLHPERALLQVQPVGGREIPPQQHVIVGFLHVGVRQVLRARHDFEAAVLFTGVHQGELDAEMRADRQADMGRNQVNVPVPGLVLAARIGIVGVVAGDVEIVDAPVSFQESQHHGVLVDLRIGIWRFPGYVHGIAIDELLPSLARPHLAPFLRVDLIRLAGLEPVEPWHEIRPYAVDLLRCDEVLEEREPADPEFRHLQVEVVVPWQRRHG